jgi:hypothetical protein
MRIMRFVVLVSFVFVGLTFTQDRAWSGSNFKDYIIDNIEEVDLRADYEDLYEEEWLTEYQFPKDDLEKALREHYGIEGDIPQGTVEMFNKCNAWLKHYVLYKTLASSWTGDRKKDIKNVTNKLSKKCDVNKLSVFKDSGNDKKTYAEVYKALSETVYKFYQDDVKEVRANWGSWVKGQKRKKQVSCPLPTVETDLYKEGGTFSTFDTIELSQSSVKSLISNLEKRLEKMDWHSVGKLHEAKSKEEKIRILKYFISPNVEAFHDEGLNVVKSCEALFKGTRQGIGPAIQGVAACAFLIQAKEDLHDVCIMSDDTYKMLKGF